MGEGKQRIGRNEPCPCGSGRKYKGCCQNTVPWPAILQRGPSAIIRHLSARGKNVLFLNLVAEALQLRDRLAKAPFAEIKRACTPEAVLKIHWAIVEIWPDEADGARILREQSSSTSGLFIGGYEPRGVLRGLTRHALYADRIVLFDPFTDPRSVRAQYSPVKHPEQWLATTMRHLVLWWSLQPWIEAGIVVFVKRPGDFDARLTWECLKTERHRLQAHPDLEAALDEEVNLASGDEREKELREYLLLLTPDERIADLYRGHRPEATQEEMNELLQFVRKRREDHPYYVPGETKEDAGRTQMLQWSTGANYEMAKVAAALSHSFLLTDMPFRWKEMEIDRKELQVDASSWEPFAKAFGNLEFKFLDNVPLNLALTLRREERLSNMRAFLRRVWRASVSDEPFDAKNAGTLGEELKHHIHEAEDEWKKIDHDLLRWLGVGAVAGMAAAGPLIAKGGAEWLGAGLAIQAVTNLMVAGLKRSGFAKRYPAGLFLKLEKNVEG